MASLSRALAPANASRYICYGIHNFFKGEYPLRTTITLFFAASLALSACSINDDLRQIRSTLPARVQGLAWMQLEPLGGFAALTPPEPSIDPRSIAARAAALRAKARALRSHPVLSPARARAMRAALRRFSG